MVSEETDTNRPHTGTGTAKADKAGPVRDMANAGRALSMVAVEAARAAKNLAGKAGLPDRVILAPSFKLFQSQGMGYQGRVFGAAPVRTGRVEFGAGAPAKALYEYFGLAARAVAELAVSMHEAAVEPSGEITR